MVNGGPDARRRRSRRWVYFDQGNSDAQYHVPLLGKAVLLAQDAGRKYINIASKILGE